MVRFMSLRSLAASFLTAACFFLSLMLEVSIASESPVKVFLLAGQSNMVGMAKIEHLRYLLNQSSCCCNEYRRALWNNSTGSFKVRKDVFYKYNDYHSNLTVPPGHTFGPELMFGWMVGDVLNETVLLIKTAWGGRTLAIDFRPPSSGKGNYTGVKPVHYGWEYRQMIHDALDALENIADYVPNYNATAGYELAGFVWFQGWNDLLNWPTVHEYAYNLANLMRDVRDDLSAPKMPVIVGELGQAGMKPTGRGADRHYAMRQAQKSVTLLDEFRNTTLFVRTAPYTVWNDTKNWGPGYHYGCRADTYFHIGQAFGRGMLSLLNINYNYTGPEDEMNWDDEMSTPRFSFLTHLTQMV